MAATERPVAPPPAPLLRSLVASRRHTVVLIAILMVVALAMAAALRRPEAAAPGSHIGRYLTLIASEWMLFAYTAGGLRRAGTPVAAILGVRWRSLRGIAGILAWAAGFWLVKSVALAAVRRGLAGLLSPVEARRTMLVMAPGDGLEAALWIVLSVSAGICEEFVYRGYLQRQLAALCRSTSAGVLLSALVFGLGHLYQGVGSVLTIAAYGLLFGGLALASRSLGPGMLAHACEDAISGLSFRP